MTDANPNPNPHLKKMPDWPNPGDKRPIVVVNEGHKRPIITERDIAESARMQLIGIMGRKRASEILADQEFEPPEYHDTLQEEHANRIDAPTFGIDGLLILGGNALITAPRKAGKTVLAINLAKAYVDNEPFLRQFKVTPLPDESRVLMMNYELTPQQFGDWASRIGIENTDRISALHLRGQGFKLKSPRAQKWLIDRCKHLNVRAIIVDPLSRASSGFGSSNSNDDMDAFTEILDEIKLQANVRELFLTNHMGWGVEERTRGASSLEGWPDALWRLNIKENDRYFSVPLGRDVELDEGKLEFDAETYRVTFEDGVSRNGATNQRVEELVLEVIRNHPGISAKEIEDEVEGIRTKEISPAKQRLIDKRSIYTKKDGKKLLHYAFAFKVEELEGDGFRLSP